MSLPRLVRVEVGALIGSHRLVRLIGRGGTASVFEAVHTALGTRCAIKVLHPEHVFNELLVRRFFGEGRAIVRIGHPNVVEVSDVGVSREGHAWMRMELLDGTPLSRELSRERRLPIARAALIAGQVARALAAAHAAGVVHRDLKPDHVFLCTRNGQRDFVKVLDFGIAKRLGVSVDERTETGVVLGTASYMSPEQRRGQRDVDHRTDVYALGLVLHLMIAGELPFAGETAADLMVQHLTVSPRTLAGAPPALAALVLRALAKDPAQRFARMDELGDALVPFGGPARAEGEPPREVGRVDDWLSAVPAPGVPGDAELKGEPTGEPTAGASSHSPRRTRAPLVVSVAVLAIGIGGALWVARAGRLAPPPVVRPSVVAPPAVTQVAPPIDLITLQVSSTPPGASVYLDDDGRPVGVTPVALSLPRSVRPLRLRLQRDGFRPNERLLPLDASREMSVALVPAQRPSRRHPPRRGGDLLPPSY